MAAKQVNHPHASKTTRPPATTPEERENQLIAYATDLAQRQLLDGTATSQVITHYLKLGSTRERLEQERLAEEVGLLKVKAAALESAKRVEELYGEALNAMRAYGGHAPLELVSGDDFDD